jgi:hypothetical protein
VRVAERAERQRLVGHVHALLQGRWSPHRNAALLRQEPMQQGYRGSSKSVQRYVRPWRDTPPPDVEGMAPPAVALPASRTLAGRLLQNDPDPNTQTLLQHVPDTEHHTLLAPAGIDDVREQSLDAWIAWRHAIRVGPDNPRTTRPEPTATATHVARAHSEHPRITKTGEEPRYDRPRHICCASTLRPGCAGPGPAAVEPTIDLRRRDDRAERCAE